MDLKRRNECLWLFSIRSWECISRWCFVSKRVWALGSLITTSIGGVVLDE